jgi:hypothetical protein
LIVSPTPSMFLGVCAFALDQSHLWSAVSAMTASQ